MKLKLLNYQSSILTIVFTLSLCVTSGAQVVGFSTTDWSFEGTNDPGVEWAQNSGFARSTEQVAGGTYSLKAGINTGNNSQKLQTWQNTANADGFFDIQSAGDYILKAKVYVTGDVPNWFQFRYEDGANSDPKSFNLSTLTADQWNDVELVYSIAAASTGRWFSVQFFSYPATGTGAVYIDDITLELDNTAGIEDNTVFNFKIYPNPVNDILTVDAPLGSNIEVFNTLGVKVKSLKNTSKISKFSVEGLRSGLYIMEIESEGRKVNSKFIVK